VDAETSNWQQKKNNQRHLYLLSLGEEMVTPHTRRADSGNTWQTYSQGHDSNGCHLKITSFLYNCEERCRKMAWKVLYLSNNYGQKNRLEMSPVLRMGVQGPLHQDNSNNMRQLQGTIILQTNFIHIYVLNCTFLSPNILFIALYITA
jgi:hypothetical protein